MRWLALALLLPSLAWSAITTVGTPTEVTQGLNNNDMTFSVPSGHAADDYCIAVVGTAGTSGNTEDFSTATTGWAQLAEDSSTNGMARTIAAFDKVLTSGAESDLVISVNSALSLDHNGILYCFRGVDTTTPIDATTTVSHTTTNSITQDQPDITTVTDNAAILITYIATHGGEITTSGVPATPTSITGWAQIDTTNRAEQYSGYKLDVGSLGAVSIGAWTHTGTASNNDASRYTFALRPAATVSVTYDADNYDLGDTVTATPVGYSDLTQIQETVGLDVILDGAGETFVLCSLSDLTPAGACNNTELGISLTWDATDGVDTASDTFTIDFPATANDFSGDVTCIAGTDCPGDAHDAWASPVTSSGTADDFYCRFTSGSGTVNGAGVVLLDGPAGTVECRIFDDSAGAWLAAASQEFTAPAAGQGSDDNCVVNEPVLNTIKEAIRNAVCQ